MKRRDLLTSVFVAGLSVPVIGGVLRQQGKDSAEDHDGHGQHDDDGRPHSNVTISFGHWGPQDTPATPVSTFDRFTNGNDRTRNHHQIIPNPAKVHAGDLISFIISGFHNPQIFGPGTQPQDIDRTVLAPPNAAFPAAPPIIADARNRVFRGADPRNISPTVVTPTSPTLLPVGISQDRVEVVSLTNPGRYLVICGVLPHFFSAATGQFIMFGFIDVEPSEN